MVNFSAFRISSSGMSAERFRLDIVASNIANADSTKSSDGGPYARRVVNFSEVAAGALGSRQTNGVPAGGVRVAGVYKDPSPFKMVYDPGHPDANAEGYVAMPNVDTVTEMTDMIAASRAYEANVTAFNAAKTMFQRALDIGS